MCQTGWSPVSNGSSQAQQPSPDPMERFPDELLKLAPAKQGAMRGLHDAVEQVSNSAENVPNGLVPRF